MREEDLQIGTKYLVLLQLINTVIYGT